MLEHLKITLNPEKRLSLNANKWSLEFFHNSRLIRQIEQKKFTKKWET